MAHHDPRMPKEHPPTQTTGASISDTQMIDDQRRRTLFAKRQDRETSKYVTQMGNDRMDSTRLKPPINSILNICHPEIDGFLVPNTEFSFHNRPLVGGTFVTNQPASSNHHGVQRICGDMERVERPFDMLNPDAEYQQRFPDMPVPKTINYVPQVQHSPLAPGQMRRVIGGYLYGAIPGQPITVTDQMVASNYPPPDQQGKPGISFPLNNS